MVPRGPRGLSLSWDSKPVGVVVTQYAAFRASDGALLNLSTGNRPDHTGYVIGDRLYGDSVTKFWLEQRRLGVRHLLPPKVRSCQWSLLKSRGGKWLGPCTLDGFIGGGRKQW